MSGPAPENVVRRMYAAFRRGDMETVKDCFTPDAVWQVPGRSPLAGAYEGFDAILGYFATLRELSGGTFRTELLELLVGDQRVAALQRATGTRGQTHLDHLACQLMTIRDGKIAEVHGFYSDQYGVDAFLS